MSSLGRAGLFAKRLVAAVWRGCGRRGHAGVSLFFRPWTHASCISLSFAPPRPCTAPLQPGLSLGPWLPGGHVSQFVRLLLYHVRNTSIRQSLRKTLVWDEGQGAGSWGDAAAGWGDAAGSGGTAGWAEAAAAVAAKRLLPLAQAVSVAVFGLEKKLVMDGTP